MEQNQQPRNNSLLQRPFEQADTLQSVTSIQPKTGDGKGDINRGIFAKFDSLLAPIISIGSYEDNNVRSQMWKSSFVARRTLASYPADNYDPMTLPMIESCRGVVLAKVTQGRKGDNNILRVLRSVWSHQETVSTSKHEEKLQAKGRVK